MSVEERIHEMYDEGVLWIYIQEHLRLVRNPNMKNEYGDTLLHRAVSDTNGYLPIVKELVSLGANINEPDCHNWTPLFLAMKNRNYDIMDFLITKGAEIDAQPSRGRTLLYYYIEHVCILEQKNQLAENGKYLLKKILQRGADPNLYSNGLTPLLQASRRNNLFAVRELLNFGGNVNLRNKGMLATCLHLLFCHNSQPNKEVIFELVKQKACVNCIDEPGRSVMDLVFKRYPNKQGLKIAKLLIKTVTLVNWESKIIFEFGTNQNLDNLREFINDCYTEVSRMRSLTYSDLTNLCQLALNSENISQNDQPFAEGVIDEVFKSLMENYFNIYEDLITSYISRKFLSEKFLNTDVYARDEKKKAVILSTDINHLLLPQLSDQDLLNMARAYSKN